jgi:hypothetical protein
MRPSPGRPLPCPISRRVAFVVLAAWMLAARVGAAEPPEGEAAFPPPLAWQEPAPLARLFLQLPFEAPALVRERTLQLGVRLLYSNSLLSGRNDELALDVHVETAQATVWVRYGLVPGIELQAAVPFIVDFGGVLDRPIEVVEGWFGFSNPQRKGRPRNVAQFQLTRPDGSGILRDGPGAGLGDAWAALKVMIAGGAGSGGSLALRAALKLPTGQLPYGSEEVDAGGSLLAGWTWTSTAVRLQLDVIEPTASLPAVHVHTHLYGAIDAGVTQRLGNRVALQLQASGHVSPLTGTGLDQLDAGTAYVLGGVTVELAPSIHLDAGIVENIFSPYRGADITFLLGVREAL